LLSPEDDCFNLKCEIFQQQKMNQTLHYQLFEIKKTCDTLLFIIFSHLAPL